MVTILKNILLMSLFVVYLINGNKVAASDSEELLAVVVVFRHGDKFPKSEYYEVYPNSPNKDPALWHGDYGGLTNRGKARLLDVGKWLRQYYGDFLPSKYSNKDIYVRASDTDRVLMSAQTLLAGLYPPEGKDIWHDLLPWQPIPVHTIPAEEDVILAQKATCPRYNELFAKNLKFNRHASINDIKNLNKHTGKEINTLQDAYRLYSILKIEEENGFQLPPWAKKAMPLLKQKTDVLTQSYSMTREMQRFKAGPFFHGLIEHFQNILIGKEGDKKLVLYGGHARTLANILTALGAFTERPPYGATVIFELKRTSKNVYVDRFYKPSSDAPQQLWKRQTFARFKELLEPIAIDITTWKQLCQEASDTSHPDYFGVTKTYV